GRNWIVMQERDYAGRGLHFFQHLLHPGGLAVRNDDLHRRVTLHDREADQGRGDEHVVVEPVGEDRCYRMAYWRRRGERRCLAGAAAAAGKWAATTTRCDRLNQSVLYLLDERAVRRPLRVPQAGRGMHRGRDAAAFQIGPKRIVIRMVQM